MNYLLQLRLKKFTMQSPARKAYRRGGRQRRKARAESDSIARFPFGPDYFKEMKIIDLKPFKQVRWTCMKGADEWIGTTISFELKPGDKGTFSGPIPNCKISLDSKRVIKERY